MSAMVLGTNVSYGTMQTKIQIDLKLTAFKKSKAELLSQTTKAKQLSRAKLLLDKLKDATQFSVLWTDEKLFTVQAIHNNQNDRIYAQRTVGQK